STRTPDALIASGSFSFGAAKLPDANATHDRTAMAGRIEVSFRMMFSSGVDWVTPIPCFSEVNWTAPTFAGAAVGCLAPSDANEWLMGAAEGTAGHAGHAIGNPNDLELAGCERLGHRIQR